MSVHTTKPIRNRRTQAERTEETRLRLFQATIASVSEGGYSRATFTEITQRAGVSIGAAQHHFQSKADLILATVEHVFSEDLAFVSEITPASGTLEERLDRLISLYWDWVRSPRYLATWELLLGARHDTELMAELRKRVIPAVERLNDLWKAAFSDINLSDDEVRQLVQFTFSVMRGMVLGDTVFLNSAQTHQTLLDPLRTMLRLWMKRKSSVSLQ